ncbi:MAG: ATP-binding protein [Eubacteriaceae bacterium]|jgi:serine/threonine-protein kinase RsbW
MDNITLMLPAKPEYVSLARLTIASVANNMGFSIEDVEDLKVAVSEACTNALSHSQNENGSYELTYVVDEGSLTFTVSDNGMGFEPDSVMAPKLDGEQVGGFGLFIIKSLMDQVEIVSRRGIGTSIRMVKNRSVCNEV